MATFGDMITAADAHLAQVTETLHHPTLRRQAEHPATVTELARLTGVLRRYADQITTVTPARKISTYETSRQAATHLRQAQKHFDAPTWNVPDGPPLALTLHATGSLLGCGLDLLASHFTSAPHDRPSPNAAVITAADSTSLLLHTISEHAETIGAVALHAGPHRQQAATSLFEAAHLTRAFGHQADAPITALRLNTIPERLPPHPAEDTAQTTHAIGISAARLNAIDPQSSITTWRYLAMSAAITSDLSCSLLKKLAHRLRELGSEDTAADLFNSARTVRSFGQRWKTVATQWRSLPATRGNPSTGLALDAGDLVVRLGRLHYGDPNWTPGPRTRCPPTTPAHLAPTTRDIGLVGTAILRALEACGSIAAHHRTAVNDIAVFNSLQTGTSLDTRYRPPAHVRDLLIRYEDIQTHANESITKLGTTLQNLTQPAPNLINQTTLILHRAAPPNAAQTARVDFPLPIDLAIHSNNVPTTPLPVTHLQTEIPARHKGQNSAH